MSDKRAAMRRENKVREKNHKKALKGDTRAIANELYVKGYDHGMTVATSIIFMALNELYGFTHLKSGKGRLDKLIEKIREESVNMTQEPTKFTCEYYVRLVRENLELDFEGDIDDEKRTESIIQSMDG